ncbi:serine/threonine-protein kinase [Oceanobacillus aidingensis]|uniref:Serine/threonine-protein kinase n=1 Tax=Oceanobacillus aidingensis TaxID=645964 RepID=A0ABV9JVG4_9BACI
MITLNQIQANLTLDPWKEIGSEGKNSKAWITRDRQLDQVLILKGITKESLERQNIEDYYSEAKMLNESKHPHIMPVHYAAEDDSMIYIAMPYYQNGSLNALMDTEFLSVKDIIKYSLDFLSGLLFIHIKGLLHLDIKPSNIIIDDTDRAILTDFGLSKHLNEHGFASQDYQYKVHRSPESYISPDKSILDDIYQAGLTMYRMCNGNTQFKDQRSQFPNNNDLKEATQKGKFPDRNYYLPHIPKKLKSIINKMTHKDATKRYRNVLNVINDLSKVEENLNWRFNKVESSENSILTFDEEKSILNVNIELVKNQYLTNAVKLNKESNNSRKQHKYTGTHNSEKEAFDFLRSKL